MSTVRGLRAHGPVHRKAPPLGGGLKRLGVGSGSGGASAAFVIDSAGVLRLAPRRSEHVVCAGGGPVLGAGEMSFREESGQWVVGEVSNQSTGYCPDISSWPAVAKALDAAGIEQPSGFIYEVMFRRCPACSQLNIVREEDFVCVFCDEDLPREWNVDWAGR